MDTPDLKQALSERLDALNVERQIEAMLQAQNADLTAILGIEGRLKMSLIDRLKRERDLGKLARNAELDLQNQKRLTAGISDKALRRNSELIEAGIQQNLTAYNKELEMIKLVNRAALIPMLYFLGQAWKLFEKMDHAAAKFRMTMGLNRDEAKKFRSMAEQISIDFMHVGVTIDGAYDSLVALGHEMGSINSVSAELVKTTAVLKAQLGVSEEITAGFLRNMAAISRSSMDAQKNMAYMAGSLSNAAGVPLPMIMKDVASRSTATLTMMSRIPTQVIKSAVELRKMGTELDKAAKSSKEILNFTDSVNAEMEASVLLGQSINLQRARQLAYNRDLVGSTQEILRLTKSISFEGLDVFQQEAFARATGKSVDELLSMVQAEKQWQAARQDPTLSARVKAYEALRASNSATLKDSAKQLELMVLQKSNQERITAITQKWDQIMAKAGEALLPVIDGLLSIIPYAMDIGKYFVMWGGTLQALGEIITPIGSRIEAWSAAITMVGRDFFRILTTTGKIGGFITSLTSKFSGVFSVVSKILGPVLKFAAPFLKLLGPIGWIITAFQAISGFIRGWNSSTGSFVDKLKGGVMGALRGIIPGFDWIVDKISMIWGYVGPIAKFLWKWTNPIGLAITGVKFLLEHFKHIGPALIDGFKSAWDWIKGIFVGKSPSNLGLGIVKGIVSIQAMLFDAITYPWRHAFAWIADKIPGMGKIADKLRGGAGGMVNSVEAKAAATYVPAAQVATTATQVNGTPTTKPQAQDAATTVVSDNVCLKTMENILDAIQNLNKNLESGKIGFYVDGQLLSATLARQTEFRGGYGVNKV